MMALDGHKEHATSAKSANIKPPSQGVQDNEGTSAKIVDYFKEKRASSFFGALTGSSIICQLVLIASCASTILSSVQAHDRLVLAKRNEPPAIYSYSALSGEPPLSLESHRSGKPYSWSNQRLSRVLASNANDANDENDANDAIGALEASKHDHDKERLEGGEFSLLPPRNYQKQRRTKTSGPDRRRPAVGSNRRRLAGGSNGATKGGAGRPKNKSAAGALPPPSVSLAPRFSPSHAAEANVTAQRRAHNKRKNLVCYYGTWAVYRPDAGKFPVENIDPFLCTHVIYGFTGLSYDNMIKPLDPWNDLEDNYGKGAMKRFTNLKNVNPDLKTIVAIGGWNEGSIKYSKMASDPEARAKFIDSVLKFLDKYNFDGLDLDWEYPGSRGGASYDKQNFVSLTRELHEAFRPRQYLLTAAVSAGKWFIDPAYDIRQISKYLDLINLMAYDYHGGWETKTGMNAPLFSSKKHDLSREDAMLNVNWSVNYWLAQGAPREKLMLGVGSYGRSFTLDKGQVNGLNAPASQKGRAGPYTREPGSLGYNELCEYFSRSPLSWTIVRDPDYLAPYAYNEAERQWVGYDDQESLALKAQFAKSMGLGGMMMWSIETDDFRGVCHNEKYPLLNTIRRVLDGETNPPTLPPKPNSRPTTTTTTTTTTTKRPAQTQRPPASSTTTTTRRPGHEVEEDEQRPSPPPPASSTRRPPVSGSSTRRPATSTKRPLKTTTTTTTRRPPLVPTKPQGGEFTCRATGMFADPQNCRKFIRCVQLGVSGDQWQSFKFDCGPGTAFDEQHGYCDHIYNVPTCNAKRVAAAAAAAEAEVSRGGLATDEPANSSQAQAQAHSNNNNNYNYLQVMGAHSQQQFWPLGATHHLVLARQHHYPGLFQQHQFMVHHNRHQWLH